MSKAGWTVVYAFLVVGWSMIAWRLWHSLIDHDAMLAYLATLAAGICALHRVNSILAIWSLDSD